MADITLDDLARRLDMDPDELYELLMDIIRKEKEVPDESEEESAED